MLTIELERIEIPDGARLLDLGCGEGRHAIHACGATNADVVALDYSHQDITSARDQSVAAAGGNPDAVLECLTGDAYRLPFAENTFDVIICSEVLEHLHHYRSALREIKRVLKPDGNLCISVPRYGPERICWALSREYHEVPGGHVRIFRARRLRADIEGLGFHHFDRHWAHALHSPYWWLQCLFWSRPAQPRIVKLWHKLLVWDLLAHPWQTRVLEKVLNPVIGKSVVMYFHNEPS